MFKLLLLALLLTGCIATTPTIERVTLYQVGQEYLFDCSSGCYRIPNIKNYDLNNNNILLIQVSGEEIISIGE